MSFGEKPHQENEPPEKSAEVLYAQLTAILLEDVSPRLSLNEREYAALIAWQKAAEDLATAKNTSLANIEVMIQRAELYIKVGRYTFAQYDIADALLAAENDQSIEPVVVEKIKNLQKEVDSQQNPQ